MSELKQDRLSSWQDGPFHYGLASRLFHWIIVILIVLSFGMAWTWSLPGRGQLQNAMVDIHRLIGVTVLLLSLIRIVLRLASRPDTLQTESEFIRLASKSVQFVLMALLILIPVFGWMYTNAGGFDVHVMGFTLPRLVARDHYLEELAVELHENLAIFLLILLCIHIVGAIRHGFKARRPVRL